MGLDLRAGLDVVVKTKIHIPTGNQSPIF